MWEDGKKSSIAEKFQLWKQLNNYKELCTIKKSLEGSERFLTKDKAGNCEIGAV